MLVIRPELCNLTNIFTQPGNRMDTLKNLVYFVTQLAQISVKRPIKQIWLLQTKTLNKTYSPHNWPKLMCG